MKMRVYIANLGKYNEGELVGEWFTLPVDMEEVKEKIGLHGEYEEYAIHDYELPFDVDEYTPISKINDLCESLQEIEGTPVFENLREIENTWFGSTEEVIEHVDDIIYHSGFDSMADLAQYYIEETGMLDRVPANLQNYIDYEAFGRDMELEGDFLITSDGIFEYAGLSCFSQ